jgi:SAM-dependent methyltransferase
MGVHKEETYMERSGGYDEYAFVAEFYDYVVPYRDRQDVAFFVEAAKESGGPVLEIGCGTGRVLIPTARAGIKILGLDLSPHMLHVCRQRLLDEPEEVRSRVQLVQADMRDFELSQAFKLVTMPFRPFQHLTSVDDQRACLACVHRHLVEGGRLILDLFNPSLGVLVSDNLGQELGDEPEFVMPDGRRVVRRHRFVSKDLFNQINHSELIYYVTHPDGRQERLVHSFPMRYLFRFEAEHLLARCGFRLEHVYGDYDKSPYGSKYPGDLIMVARKMES